jgi:hypothetical protein
MSSPLTFDLGAVGALEVRDHDLVLIFLDLDVEAADALVVELERVSLFAADGDRRGQLVIDTAAIGPVEHA